MELMECLEFQYLDSNEHKENIQKGLFNALITYYVLIGIITQYIREQTEIVVFLIFFCVKVLFEIPVLARYLVPLVLFKSSRAPSIQELVYIGILSCFVEKMSTVVNLYFER